MNLLVKESPSRLPGSIEAMGGLNSHCLIETEADSINNYLPAEIIDDQTACADSDFIYLLLKADSNNNTTSMSHPPVQSEPFDADTT